MERRDFLKNSILTGLVTVDTGLERNNRGLYGTIKYRRLGRTNLMISEISLGGSPVPPEAVFRQALERGVNYVDTSSSYMNGNSERLIGKILKDYPGRLYVATKFHAGRRGHDKITLEQEFEGSLKRLGVNTVDILMVHGARTPDILLDEDVLSLFEKFKKQGRIRFCGISCHHNPVEVLTPAVKSGHYDVINIAYNAFSGSRIMENAIYENYLEKSGIEQVIDLAKQHDLGVIAMKTMAGGDRQNLDAYKKEGISLPQAKLKWVLENKNIASALSEMLTFDILEENLQICWSPLSIREKEALISHVNEHTTRYCRMCGTCQKACPLDIPIPDIFRYMGYALNQGKKFLAREKYDRLVFEQGVAECNRCDRCLDVCPYGLSIPGMIHTASRLLT
jgi:predicted aldo/keto reductase-like oxidoreductase